MCAAKNPLRESGFLVLLLEEGDELFFTAGGPCVLASQCPASSRVFLTHCTQSHLSLLWMTPDGQTNNRETLVTLGLCQRWATLVLPAAQEHF